MADREHRLRSKLLADGELYQRNPRGHAAVQKGFVADPFSAARSAPFDTAKQIVAKAAMSRIHGTSFFRDACLSGIRQGLARAQPQLRKRVVTALRADELANLQMRSTKKRDGGNRLERPTRD